jgi:hypothetical protein
MEIRALLAASPKAGEGAGSCRVFDKPNQALEPTFTSAAASRAVGAREGTIVKDLKGVEIFAVGTWKGVLMASLGFAGFEARTPGEIDSAFAAMTSARAGALVVLLDGMLAFMRAWPPSSDVTVILSSTQSTLCTSSVPARF